MSVLAIDGLLILAFVGLMITLGLFIWLFFEERA